MIYTTETLREALSEFKNPNYKIHRMIREKKLFPSIRGLYTTDPEISGKCLACFIYGPSYLSFDYALAQYRLIDKKYQVAIKVQHTAREESKATIPRSAHSPIEISRLTHTRSPFERKWLEIACTASPHRRRPFATGSTRCRRQKMKQNWKHGFSKSSG